MQRRALTQSALGFTALIASSAFAALGWPALASAQATAFRDGRDFRRLRRLAPVDAPAGQIEVLEFFAYTCVHCHSFIPIVQEWKRTLAPDVVLRHVPVGFNASFVPLQRLYYTLEAMGRVESHHARVFQAIHADRQRLDTPAAMAQWAERNGLDKTQFNQVFNSFAVNARVARATQLQDAYEVEGTPALGIAGRFYIPGQAARTLQIANALIAEVRRA